jgi:hypothetical protein
MKYKGALKINMISTALNIIAIICIDISLMSCKTDLTTNEKDKIHQYVNSTYVATQELTEYGTQVGELISKGLNGGVITEYESDLILSALNKQIGKCKELSNAQVDTTIIEVAKYRNNMIKYLELQETSVVAFKNMLSIAGDQKIAIEDKQREIEVLINRMKEAEDSGKKNIDERVGAVYKLLNE